uniref:Cytochrome c biogenesis protein CcsA n=1 Tax=Rhipilia penicilloides TaxID=1979422 RepID=A0A2P0QHK7_9CHLO|nr:cytochrome c biogenesis protein ccs1 [Rhipilia penicilloides]ARO74257.1 cytochrome c biogenesis protein ccs1 [Rhipilia penicilloides]
MENFLNNSSFFLLLCSMTFYWMRAFLNFSIFAHFGKLTILSAQLIMFFLLIYRGIGEHHFPLSNIFLSWGLTIIHLILEAHLSELLIGAVTAPTALFLNAFASFQLPASFQKFHPLIPALQSNWLMMHVTVMLLSYATLLSGCLLSIAFLFFNVVGRSIFQIPTRFSSGPLYLSDTNKRSTVPIKTAFYATKKTQLLTKLDQLSFRAIGIGFPLLTLGILSGSVWANEAWGSYWNWDPKETWSLITWLIFAIYLHLRFTQNWKGWKSAMLATLGFFVVWICFLGVNFVSKGLHSYGWFH